MRRFLESGAKRASGIALLLGTLACGDAPEERITIGSETYAIPVGQVASLNREGHIFLRIKHPDIPFDIVYDSRTEGLRDKRGLPRIFSINDAQAPTIGQRSSDRGTIVCRRAVNPRGGCGLKFRQEGAEWAILFPETQIARAPQFVEAAQSLLERYEQ